ncbi:MAG: class I SAM-dependent methyltransferase [Saprospiraceae bacterium]
MKNKLLNLDDPNLTIERKETILNNKFLRNIYAEWYGNFTNTKLPDGKLLEIGSGGGFLKDVLPKLITSDILDLPFIEMKLDAQELPFESNSLAGIFMVNVFHHIPNPELFLKEAERVLVPSGQIIMIEPANTFISRIIYKNLHHEPFEPNGGWTIESGKPLSNSNQALPYIYFERDVEKFNSTFPNLNIQSIKYHTPLKYLVSGGVSRKAFVPIKSYSFFTFLEKILTPLNKYISLFETVVLSRK